MRTYSLLRIVTVALSLLVTTGAMSTAFAAPAPQQSGAYDSPDFVAPLNNTY